MKEFSLLGFAAHLTEMVERFDLAKHSALDEAARIVQMEAKAEIGHYQAAAGPVAAWPELADSTKQDRVRQGYTENDPLLRDGKLRDSIERTVLEDEAHVGSDSEIAVFQELGTAKMPPRSFLAGALIRKTDEVREKIGDDMVGSLIGQDVPGGLRSLV